MKIDFFRALVRQHLKKKNTRKGEIDINNINTILIMSNTAIGDTLFTTPAIRNIKKQYPDKCVIALLNPINHHLFGNNPYIDKVILYRGKWRNFLNIVFRLRKLNIDLTFIMHSNEPQATPMAYYAGSKYIIKIPNSNNEFNFLHHNPPVAAERDEHFIDRRLRQLEYINIHDRSYQMDIFLKPHWLKKISDLNLLKGDCVYIGFQMGASTRSRMWFLDRWVNLANKLLNHNRTWHVILTGSKSDYLLAEDFLSNTASDRVINLVGRLDIGPASALIHRLDLLVTPDTGPLHIAAAVNTPTVAISVAGRAIESNPRDNAVPHIFIEKPKTCSPCLDKKCKNQKCMLQITSDEVFHHVCNILQ